MNKIISKLELLDLIGKYKVKRIKTIEYDDHIVTLYEVNDIKFMVRI